ncbi:hypothetical protein LHU95_06330 [Sediminicoccus sp. KRV36]|nr:hypothetical protein LHU95_06330 [Sediminicoccus rosea]
MLEMGLGLSATEALKGLRNRHFLAYGAVFGLVLGPLLAWLLTRIVPLEEPYAVGLLMLGMAPCAPFLPALVTRARRRHWPPSQNPRSRSHGRRG